MQFPYSSTKLFNLIEELLFFNVHVLFIYFFHTHSLDVLVLKSLDASVWLSDLTHFIFSRAASNLVKGFCLDVVDSVCIYLLFFSLSTLKRVYLVFSPRI